MKPERWEEINRLYHAAVDLKKDQRAQFLDQACAGDAELRGELEQLISSNAQVGDFIEMPALEVAAKDLAADPEPEMPSRIGSYEVLSLIGSGGMGRVYLGMDKRLNRKVALKVITPEAMGDGRARKRLLKEAQSAASLDHPNICTVYEIGEDRGQDFIAMQYVEGETLDRRLKGTRLEVAEATACAMQIADALVEAHRHGIIHRDIKPQNIMITAGGQVKVLDFGLAKGVEGSQTVEGKASEDSVLTGADEILGTVPYMSPEQIRGETVDARSDIFSLGSVLYEMVTGRRAFQAETTAATIAQVLTDQPRPLAEFIDDIPDTLQRIVGKALRKDKVERHQSAEKLLVDLKGLRHGIDTSSGIAATSGSGSSQLFDSLAVLPLRNVSRDSEEEYFADGMTEMITSELGKISELRVISRKSAMHFKGSKKSIPEIGRELNVSALVEGSVFRDEKEVRITVELINTATDRLIWTESYHRNLAGIIQLQREVAKAIAKEIRVKLTPRERAQLASAPDVNPEAQNVYLKGLYYLHKATKGGYFMSIEYFNLAIQIDSSHALSYAGIAAAKAFLAGPIIQCMAPKMAMKEAKIAAQRALELDETLAEAHCSMGRINLFYDWDWPRAEREFRKAIELKPSFQGAHVTYAVFLTAMGRYGEAIPELKQVKELAPLSLPSICAVGWCHYAAREFDKAIAQYRDILAMDPDFRLARRWLGMALLSRGAHEEALGEFQSVSGMDVVINCCLGLAYAMAGKKREAIQALDDVIERSRNEYVPCTWITYMYATLGERDSAFQWLERAIADREHSLIWLRSPMHDALRSDPRFEDVLRRMNFPKS